MLTEIEINEMIEELLTMFEALPTEMKEELLNLARCLTEESKEE